jgi:N,N'-diacetylchitobiose transport system substrate-binding protein
MAWIADYTNTKSEKGMQAVGNIPNATNLLDNSLNDQAAKVSWFVPTAKHWADVESKNYVRTMLAHILTGTSVKAAATQADKQIAATLNKP